MTEPKSNSYGRFVGRVAGAGILGGILAAAGEYVLGAVFRPGAFWGEPRLFYQLLLGTEVLWVTLVSGAVLTLGASVFYAFRRRKAAPEIASVSTLVLATAALGVPAFYYLATVDGAWFYDKPRIITAAVFAVAVAAWFGAVWGVHALWGKVGARFPAAARLAAHVLRVSTLVLLIPFVMAEGRALWRTRAAPPRGPDIYLVVMDAFRADRLSFYGAERELAPVLERFGRRAVVFREAFTVSSWTKPAVASIFTAAYPGAHGVNARFYGIPEGANTLPDVLRGGGYFTIGVSANPNVGRDALMARGFDVMDNSGHGSILGGAGPPLSCARFLRVFPWARRRLGPLWGTTGDGVKMNRRVEFYRRLAGDRPAFFYIHYMETHTPNMPRPEYLEELKPFLEKVDKKRVKHVAGGPFFWNNVLRDPSFVPDFTDDELALAKALYDADVRRADVVIKDFLENVVGSSTSERGAIVVLTSDHGEEFLEHGRWLHGAGLHHEVARVPLMVKAPDCAPAILAGPVNLVDLPPTLASFAGCAIPDGWDGLDLGPYMREGADLPKRELLLEGLHVMLAPPLEEGVRSAIALNAVVAGGHYYLRDENAGTEFLYDRENDPWQEYNLARGASVSETAALLAREREVMARAKKAVAANAFTQDEVRLSPALQRQLKALGYVR